MLTALNINGISLIPIKDAVKHSRYTRDYIARLAREGKIVASQVERQWYIDATSLENFSVEASAIDEIRRQGLKAERKRELMAKDSLSVLDEKVSKHLLKQRFDALVVTAATVSLGLFAGVGVYLSLGVPNSPFSDFARSLAIVSIPVQIENEQPVVAPLPVHIIDEEYKTLLLNTSLKLPVFVKESVTEKISTGLSGVLVLSPGSNLPTASDIEDMFSDQVEVLISGDSTGVITYVSDHQAKRYPFVLVPEEETRETIQ